MPPFMTEKREPVSLVAVEIQAERRADVDVVLDLEIERRRRADLAHFHVARFVGTDRHRFVRQVRHRFHERGQLGLHHRQRGFVGLELVAQAAHFRHHGRRVFALALEHADLLGQRIALALQFFGAGLDRLRSASRALKPATSSWNLRLARRAATVSMSLRRSWMSIMANKAKDSSAGAAAGAGGDSSTGTGTGRQYYVGRKGRKCPGIDGACPACERPPCTAAR
jgi:hypothetical protein